MIEEVKRNQKTLWFFIFFWVLLPFQTWAHDGPETHDGPQAHDGRRAQKTLGAAATQHPLATRTAEKILREGGNAVDAAVGAAFTLAVVEPYNSGLGGGGMALIWMAKDKRMHALDFRETAPSSSTPDFYQKSGLPPDASRVGSLAIAVPGEVAGLDKMHQFWGRLAWGTLMEDALLYSEKGFEADKILKERILEKKECLSSDPDTQNAYSPLFKEGPPSRWPQKNLSESLKRLRDQGAKDFYVGKLAQEIDRSLKAKGALLGLEDLKNYQVKIREPLSQNFSFGRVWGMPLPSSGGTLILQGLKKLEALSRSNPQALKTHWAPWLIQVFGQIFAARSQMGDPDFAKAHTTHLSVIDSEGNAVAMTLTLNLSFGSCVTAGKTGILMNDEMDDFTTQPNKPNAFGLVQSTTNRVEGGKRPLSSMSPTLVTRKDRVVLAVGSPGGPRIITSVLQTLARYFLLKESLSESVAGPRLHFQGEPRKVFVEEDMSAQSSGFTVVKEKPWGNVQAVSFSPSENRYDAVSDPRGMGKAVIVTGPSPTESKK